MEIVRHTLSKQEIELLKTCVDQGTRAAEKTKEMPDHIRMLLNRMNGHLKTAQRISITYISP